MKETFNIKKINKDIYLITEPYFREHANLYLIVGNDRDLLVDAGLGVCDVREFLLQKGFKPDLFLTHAHFDHAGGTTAFLPSELRIPASILENLRHEELNGLKWLKADDFDVALTRSLTGKSPEDICALYKTQALQVEPLSGQKICVGRYSFEIIGSPGHTDDSVVLYDKKHKLLISGDTLYDGELYANFPNSNKEEFIRSLTLLNSLDVDLTLPGHNGVLNGNETHAVIGRWLEKLEDR
jgi:glyoxylase-like metal-dependent hydrolase (beta-lactamase superfamily II)